MMTEAFLEEDTLMRVLVIGLTRELPLSPADALDIADKLVARAANAHTEGNTVRHACKEKTYITPTSSYTHIQASGISDKAISRFCQARGSLFSSQGEAEMGIFTIGW